MPLQRLCHEAQSCGLVAGFGNIAFQHLALVIDGAPQVHHLPVHPHVSFIQMPLTVAEPAHAADPLTTNVGGKQRSKLVPPEPHRLVTQIDPMLEQKVLDIP